MVADPVKQLSKLVVLMMYFGDVVFAISGAIVATRHRMDILGCILIGTITGIGGGTVRDLLLGRQVWWIQRPLELLLCVVASILVFLLLELKLCHIALDYGSAISVAIFMGMLTATGGGVIRDVLTQTRPMILCGELYATAALAGALGYVIFLKLGSAEPTASLLAFLVAFLVRGIAIAFQVRLGPPGDFLRLGKIMSMGLAGKALSEYFAPSFVPAQVPERPKQHRAGVCMALRLQFVDAGAGAIRPCFVQSVLALRSVFPSWEKTGCQSTRQLIGLARAYFAAPSQRSRAHGRNRCHRQGSGALCHLREP